jgi:magnesium transporter
MDTPRSATPSYSMSPVATELDDHRLQPHSLPRSNTVTSHRPRSRDESAYIEPGTPVRVDHVLRHHASIVRSHHDYASSVSSRSPSPPNSVDAFANPEHRRLRDRSGTMCSEAPSELRLGLRRTVSRRPTFTDDRSSHELSNDAGSQKAEEDVCFPPPEEARIRGGIDFEEMDEFVALQNRGRSGQRQRKMSMAGSVTGQYYANLSRKVTPQTTRSDNECAIDDSDSIINEKMGTAKAESIKPTSLPDRYSFFSSEMDTTIHAPEIGDLLFEGESFADLFGPGQGVWWLDCLNPTQEELAMLMKSFSIHPLTAEDIRVQETREKVELFKSYYFVCFRSFVQRKSSEDYLEPINVYLIVFRDGILSFHFAPSNHSANVRRRIRQLRDYVALSSDWICYALIDDIVDSFAPLINDIENDSDAIEDAVFVARIEDYSALLKRIGECRKKTMGSMRLLGGKADVIKGFAKRCNEMYSVTPRGEIGLYLGDIQDHIVTMMSNLGHFEKMLSRSHANYLAQLSVDSMEASSRANEVLGKITTVATILVPLNLICGLFGMNVPVPGMNSDSLAWFFGIIGSIFLFCVVSFWVAKRWRLI